MIDILKVIRMTLLLSLVWADKTKEKLRRNVKENMVETHDNVQNVLPEDRKLEDKFPSCPPGEVAKYRGWKKTGPFLFGSVYQYNAPEIYFHPTAEKLARCSPGMVHASLQLNESGQGECIWNGEWSDNGNLDECRAKYIITSPPSFFESITCFWTVCEKEA